MGASNDDVRWFVEAIEEGPAHLIVAFESVGHESIAPTSPHPDTGSAEDCDGPDDG